MEKRLAYVDPETFSSMIFEGSFPVCTSVVFMPEMFGLGQKCSKQEEVEWEELKPRLFIMAVAIVALAQYSLTKGESIFTLGRVDEYLDETSGLWNVIYTLKADAMHDKDSAIPKKEFLGKIMKEIDADATIDSTQEKLANHYVLVTAKRGYIEVWKFSDITTFDTGKELIYTGKLEVAENVESMTFFPFSEKDERIVFSKEFIINSG